MRMCCCEECGVCDAVEEDGGCSFEDVGVICLDLVWCTMCHVCSCLFCGMCVEFCEWLCLCVWAGSLCDSVREIVCM
jgi:hypothetical protein